MSVKGSWPLFRWIENPLINDAFVEMVGFASDEKIPWP